MTISSPVEDGEYVDGPTLNATFTTEAGATTQCRVDNGSYRACSSPTSFTGLGQGQHTFSVLATDTLGNQSVTNRVFYTDLTPPNPPANDLFANATALTAAAPDQSGTNEDASAEAGEPAHVRPARRSVWFKYTAPASRRVTVTSCGSAFDTVLAVYTGSAVGALTQVVADDDGECGTGSVVRFDAQQGTTYWIALDSYGVGRGTYKVALDVPPVNDARRSPQRLTDGAETTGSTVRATGEGDEPTGAHSVWFSVTPPRSGRVLVQACGTTFAATLSAYDASGAAVGNGTDVGCGAAAVRFAGVAGQTYLIKLDGGAGDYRVSALLSDDRAAARVLAPTGTAVSTTVGATTEAGETGTRTVWFELDGVEAGRHATFDTCDSALGSLDTVLSVVSGATVLASNDDTAGCGPGGHGSRVTVTGTGAPLLVSVDAKSAGRFTLRTAAPPANDDRANAATVAPDATAISGTTIEATRESGEADHAGVPGTHSVWFRWTPTAAGAPGSTSAARPSTRCSPSTARPTSARSPSTRHSRKTSARPSRPSTTAASTCPRAPATRRWAASPSSTPSRARRT